MTDLNPSPTFSIGNIPVYGDVILAPMAGYADIPHRLLCKKYGSAVQYTEFVAAEDILSKNKKMLAKLNFLPEIEHPMVFQIFSNSAERLLNAAKIIAQRNPDAIDINMGCSTRRVSGRGAGVGLMKKPLEVAKIYSSLTAELPMPITGKIRLGWEEDKNYLEIGRIMEENGASLVAIHPRTKQQGYKGLSDWDAIARLKQALSIPVIGNGDIQTPADIDRMIDYTNCDAVMIGRGAIGNPWIFGRQSRDDLSRAQLLETARFHVNEMVKQEPIHGLRRFRKHLKAYAKSIDVPSEFMTQMVTTNEFTPFLELLNQLEDVVRFPDKSDTEEIAVDCIPCE